MSTQKTTRLSDNTTLKGADKTMKDQKTPAVKKVKKPKKPNMLKKARMDMGMSIYSLGDKMGVSYSTISYWENGQKHPRHDKIESLEDIFGKSYRELFTDLSEEDIRILKDKVNSVD